MGTQAQRQLYIGTSGFSYQHWRGVFYPQGLAQSRWLEFYQQYFTTVELNVTFYRMPTEKAFITWERKAPAGFLYAVKLSRYLTHLKRLLDADDSLHLFEERAGLLGAHLGPVLIQLPPSMHLDIPRLEDFLVRCNPGLRWAVEFREESWLTEETFAMLSRHGVALCIHDLLPDHPRIATADFVYVRFHGSGAKYGGSYPDAHLRNWADQLLDWQGDGKAGFAYFNNDAHGYAVQNARTLQKMTGGSMV